LCNHRLWKRRFAIITHSGIDSAPSQGFGGYVSTTREGGIYESLDGGRTWTEITGDIAYTKPLVLRYAPATQQLWVAGPAAFRTKR